MKIYIPQPPVKLIRLQIRKKDQKSFYITLCKTDMNKVIEHCKNTIKAQNIDPFSEGSKTSIHVRKAIGSKNLESKSISFIGLSTEDTYNLIVDSINSKFK